MKTKTHHTFRVTRIVLAVLMIFIGASISWYWYRKSDPSCGKWLVYQKGKQKINTVQDAMKLFSTFLPTQSFYAKHKLPQTLEGYKQKYNLIPFKTTKQVMIATDTYKTKEVYDMLLAYAIGTDGTIYMYNQCSLLH